MKSPNEVKSRIPIDNILVFSPHSGWSSHGRFEHLISNFLSNSSSRVTVLRCSQVLYGGCALHALQASRQMGAVCGKCLSNKENFDSRALYESRAIEEYLSTEEVTQINRFTQDMNVEDIINFSKEGIPLGKFWLYDLCISEQSAEAFRDPQNTPALRALARAGLLAFETARKIHSRERFDALIVFSREYAVNRSFSAHFESSDCQVFNLHPRGPSFSRFYSFSASKSNRADNALADSRIGESMLIPVTKAELVLIKKHLLSAIHPIDTDRRLFFSLPKGSLTSEEVRVALGLSKHAAVVTVLMSSPDETEAAVLGDMYPQKFGVPDDKAHLSSIMTVAAQMPDIQFVFRWHPRGFIDGLRSVDSQLAMEKVLSDFGEIDNVFMNFPSDHLSLYDLAKVTNLALSYRSTAAWDFGAIGIPIVQLDESHDPGLLIDQDTAQNIGGSSLAAQIRRGLIPKDSAELAAPYLRLYASAFLRLNTPIRSIGRRRYSSSAWFARLKNSKLKQLLGALRRYESIEYFLTLAIGHRWRYSRETGIKTLQKWENWLEPLGVPRESREGHLIRRFQREIWSALGPFDGLEAAPANKFGTRLAMHRKF